MVTAKIVKSAKEMYDVVMDEYRKYSTELNSSFFDFNVNMSAYDILTTYKELQEDINGDEVCRVENGAVQDDFIKKEQFDYMVNGNLMTYLKSFNNNAYFIRRMEEDVDGDLHFIW